MEMYALHPLKRTPPGAYKHVSHGTTCIDLRCGLGNATWPDWVTDIHTSSIRYMSSWPRHNGTPGSTLTGCYVGRVGVWTGCSWKIGRHVRVTTGRACGRCHDIELFNIAGFGETIKVVV